MTIERSGFGFTDLGACGPGLPLFPRPLPEAKGRGKSRRGVIGGLG
jgi:hypothetical protein